jgi:diaminopimelate epimerase
MRRMFVKMHGAGNHFLIVEPHFFGLSNQRASINTFSQEELDSIRPRVFKLCQPNFGIGADGILVMSQG